MTSDPEPRADDSDAETIRLLRLAGTRTSVPTAPAARVRAAVHAEWRATVRRRTARRRIVISLAAVTAAGAWVLMSGTWSPSSRRSATPPGELVAVVEQIDGAPRRTSPASDELPSQRLSIRDDLRVDEWIETDGQSRVALRFPDGTSVRLDVGSRARLLSRRAIELSGGAVYVDTGRESGRFEVRTATATARDVGTQFEVRLVDRAVRLRVRSGVVELADAARSVTGQGGTEITWSATAIASRDFAPYGDEWNWIGRVSSPLDIEGVALADFLARTGRELGWAIRYADAALAEEAAGIRLHGSVNGLSLREAIEVAITTSGLQHRIESGSLVVLRGADPP
jgi:ferric-dicitrate binding protein FerR (iron transport regulator)